MDKKEIEMILQEGEGLKVEFKESFDTKEIAKQITAFTNSEGGRIFLGISDKKEIKGIEISNKLKSQIQDIAHNCDPNIKIEIENFDNVLIINIKEGENKPYQCSSGFYIREGPNTQKLSRDEIIKFVRGVGRIKFDELINDNFRFPKDFDIVKFNDFLRKSNIFNVNNTSDILINLSLAKKIGNKLKKELVEEYEKIQNDALEIACAKAEEIIKNYDFELDKRSKFQYEMSEEIKEFKAKTSLERAKEFVFEMKKLI